MSSSNSDLCSSNSAPPGLLAGFWGGEETERRGGGRKCGGGEREEKVRAGNGEGDKGKENGTETEKEEGCGREEFCADAIFP